MYDVVICQACIVDVVFCVKVTSERVLAYVKKPSILYHVADFYAKVLLDKYIRPIVVRSPNS